ncbi:hypothetical protein PM8797T_31408 [Gimesia maris DSM 8797]|uniref:AAA family ATPase n=1 Tax=Gimesia maris TaxID=122 RepID=A0ABX5YM69_9PLAN|nr:hypothetical protein PM8797T_31408 [Gimesia maris DSM 8797]QEG16719.1 hypothetical protein GmarT_25860 [Gimesia maris]QGQ30121.1 AAA family ATPase [Gimesia maris]
MNISKADSRRRSRSAGSKRPTDTLKRFGLIQSVKFADLDCEHEWLIEGILVKGQAGVIGGPAKCLKTGFIIDMAISLGSETPFLGKFHVPTACRVAVMSGESGKSSIQDTANRIAETKGLSLRNISGVYWGFTLPILSDEKDLEMLGECLRWKKIQVVFIDPLYLCLCGGGKAVSPTNLYQVGPILKRLTETCLKAGATPVLVHHTTKAAAKPSENASVSLYDLAFSGVGEFFRQWVLLNKREEFTHCDGFHQLGMSVGGSAGHSGKWNIDVREGVLDNDFRGRKWDVSVWNGPAHGEEEPENMSGGNLTASSILSE